MSSIPGTERYEMTHSHVKINERYNQEPVQKESHAYSQAFASAMGLDVGGIGEMPDGVLFASLRWVSGALTNDKLCVIEMVVQRNGSAIPQVGLLGGKKYESWFAPQPDENSPYQRLVGIDIGSLQTTRGIRYQNWGEVVSNWGVPSKYGRGPMDGTMYVLSVVACSAIGRELHFSFGEASGFGLRIPGAKRETFRLPAQVVNNIFENK